MQNGMTQSSYSQLFIVFITPKEGNTNSTEETISFTTRQARSEICWNLLSQQILSPIMRIVHYLLLKCKQRRLTCLQSVRWGTSSMVLTRQSDRKDRSIFCATSRALLLNSCHSVASEHHLRALSGVTAYKERKEHPHWLHLWVQPTLANTWVGMDEVDSFISHVSEDKTSWLWCFALSTVLACTILFQDVLVFNITSINRSEWISHLNMYAVITNVYYFSYIV